MKTALITGVTGMDGSYLAEFLLEKGYEVHGIVRRSSSFNRERIEHLHAYENSHRDNLYLHYGDMADSSNLSRIVREVLPDEIYHLAAQSHVKISFDIPEYTADVDGVGTLRLLEAVRSFNESAKFYNASTSELFGKAKEFPQTEQTPFYPRSPYGVAKLYSHWIVCNYREAYDLFACNGLLFNHECITSNIPIIINIDGLVDVIPIEELVPHRENLYHSIKFTTPIKDSKIKYKNRRHKLYIWDGGRWAKIKTMTATGNIKSIRRPPPKKIISVVSRGGYYECTPKHISFLENEKEIETQNLAIGDRLELKPFPPLIERISMTNDECEFLGMIVADGYVKNSSIQFTKNDDKLRNRVNELWMKITGGTCKEVVGTSGFSENDIYHTILKGNTEYIRLIRNELYTKKKSKRIPLRVLNTNKKNILSFLQGYNRCDGLKAGRQKTEFKSFSSESSVLSLGLWYLINKCLELRITLHPEFKNDKVYYHLNINSDNNVLGQHLKKPLNEVKKLIKSNYNGWLFDLETDSGTFSAGVGLTWIHNSPRRGENFVTRKITLSIANILVGKQKKLYLGNLNAKRDWGYAKDYVRAMFLMLQQKRPEDYVIATGEAHSIREFVELAFNEVNIPIKWEEKGIKEKGINANTGKVLIEVSAKYFRPAEVEYLLGDASKARKQLGWKPETSFKELVKIMVKADLDASRTK